MIAVLTGDLVGSTRLSQDDYHQAIASLKRFLDGLSKRHDFTFAVYRGDEFQIAFNRPQIACHITLQIKSWLASGLTCPALACTLSLAYGPGEISGTDPGINNGPAYIRSGRELEKLNSAEWLVQTESDADNRSLIIICQQMSYILNRLNARQAELVYIYLAEGFPTHQILADKMGTSRQNISERIRAAGADLLANTIDFINDCAISTSKENR